MYKLSEYMVEFDTLTPTIQSLENADWWTATKTQFDDLIWLYYDEREILPLSKYNSGTDTENYNNILKAFEIYLKHNARRYERVFDAFTADFNVLWNVDGVTGTVRESDKSGFDTLEKTGDEKLSKTGKEANTRTGNETHAGTGQDTETTQYLSKFGKNGTKETEYTGDEYTTNQNATFDSPAWQDSEKSTHDMHNRKDTETYTNYSDDHTGKDIVTNALGSTMTDTYNNVKDELSFTNREDKTEFNTTDKTTYNTSDKFVEMVIRQGNIGVVSSDKLLTDAITLFNSTLYDFYKMVVRDCVNLVTYRVY